MTELRDYTGKETVLGWINIDKQVDLKPEDVDFGIPVRNEATNPEYNTTIIVTPKLENMFIGEYTLNYDRIHVTKFGVVMVEKDDATTFYELLPKVNEVCNVIFTVEDLEDYELGGDLAGLIAVDLLFKPESVMYYSGAIIYTPINPEPPPPDPDNPDEVPEFPVVGTKIGEYCQGPDLWGVFANGSGGYYRELIDVDVRACGYIPGPSPEYTSIPGPNWDSDKNANIVHPGQPVDILFELTNAVTRGLYFDLYFVWETTVMADIESIQYSYNDGEWKTVPNTLTFVLPRDKASFTVRLNIKPGLVLLPDKHFDVEVRVNPVSVSHVNPGAITNNEVTIARTSYDSLLTLANTQLVLNEGTNAQLVYNLNQPIADNTELEIWFDYNANLVKHFSSIQYSCTVLGGGSNVLNQPVTLDALTNKGLIPLPIGTNRLTVSFFVTYDISNTNAKLCSIKTQEFTILPKLTLIDNGTGTMVPGFTNYAVEVKTPASIPNNTLLETYCVAYEKWGKFWRNNAVVDSIIEADSAYCGFIPPRLQVTRLLGPVYPTVISGTRDTLGVHNYFGQGFRYTAGITSKNKTDTVPPRKMYLEIAYVYQGNKVESLSFGINKQSNTGLGYIGATAGSFGFFVDRDTSQLYKKSLSGVVIYGPVLNVDDTIGLLYDGVVGDISLTVNGTDLGVAHSGVNGEDIYFVIGSSDNGAGGGKSAFVNFGLHGFKHQPPLGYQPGFGKLVPAYEYIEEVPPALNVLIPTTLLDVGNTNESLLLSQDTSVVKFKASRLFTSNFKTSTGKYYFEVNMVGGLGLPIQFGFLKEGTALYPTPDDDIQNEGDRWGTTGLGGTFGVYFAYSEIMAYKYGVIQDTIYEETDTFGIEIDFDTKSVVVRYSTTGKITVTGLTWTAGTNLMFAIGLADHDSAYPDPKQAIAMNFGQRPFKYTVPSGFNPGFGELI